MRNFFLLLTISSLLSTSLWAQTGYVQEGKASFYADKFEGRTTASGERYSHSRSTCAHLTLPFGTLVRVTNLENSQTVVVRVNDRGPFVANRIIDLSRSAAEKLGFVDKGLANVRIEVIDEDGKVVATAQQSSKAQTTPTPQKPIETGTPANKQDQTAKQPERVEPVAKPSTPTPKAVLNSPMDDSGIELYELKVTRQKPNGFTVQIGSYKELVNLLRIADDLKSSLKKDVRVQVAEVNGEKIYRLMVGEFNSRREADAFKSKAAQLYPDCFIVELK